ncbi:MAG: hypothetical protein ACXAD7_07320 [Candidatus Kariarchaeaceae archaeon]|jgi:hypothetical protein
MRNSFKIFFTALVVFITPWSLNATFIEQSTAPVMIVGQFVDFADGITREDGIAISGYSGVEYAKLIKGDGTEVDVKSRTWAETTIGGASDSGGWYKITLSTSDTNTVGRTIIMFNDPDVYVPVWHEFTVVASNIYDSIVGNTDTLQVDVSQVEGNTTPASDNIIAKAIWDEQTSVHVDSGSYGDLASVGEIADGVWDEDVVAAHDTADTAGEILETMDGKILDAAGTEAEVEDALQAMNLDHLMDVAVTGTDVVDNSVIAKLVSGSATADWDDFDNTTESLQAWFDSLSSDADIADAVWDEDVVTAHDTANTAGMILEDTNSKLPTNYIMGSSVQTDKDDEIDDIPTTAEFNARTLVAASYFDPTTDAVANVTLVDTTTTNTDMVSEPLSAAATEAEVEDALQAMHLDHLLGVDYDPAAKPGVATALLNELIESDVGVSRFTANALEQAPSGGTPPTAAAIADAVWDETETGHIDAGKAGAQLWTDINDILSDTSTTLDGYLNTEIADILADTGELQTNQGNWVTATGFATSSALSTHDGKLDTVDGIVDAILIDTGTTLDDLIDTEIADILADTAAFDTASERRSALFSTDNQLVVDANGRTDVSLIEGTDATNQINTEADTALSDIGLDHLVSAAVIGTDVTDNSIIAQIVSGSVTADWDDFDSTTESLQAWFDSLSSDADIADAVWDEATSGHTTPGTYGDSPTVDDIADGVWDETSTGHVTAGYAGAQLWTDVDAILTDTALYDTDAEIADAVWNADHDNYEASTEGFGFQLDLIFDILAGDMEILTGTSVMEHFDYYSGKGTTAIDFYLYDDTETLSTTNIYERANNALP